MYNKSFPFIFLAIAGALRADAHLLETKIVGGTEASSITYQVSLRMHANEYVPGAGFRCGGSLVTPKTVLTAAHCAFLNLTPLLSRPIDPSELFIVAGDLWLNQTSTTSQSRNVSEIIIHPEYSYTSGSIGYDLSLLILDESIVPSERVQPIPMALLATPDETLCQVSGWGSLSYGSYASNSLMVVSIPIVDYARCNFSYAGYISDSMICASDYEVGGKDACQGDSGGPLVCNGNLTGIVSFGMECGLAFYPGVYTNVSYFSDWIKENLDNAGSNLLSMRSLILGMILSVNAFQ